MRKLFHQSITMRKTPPQKKNSVLILHQGECLHNVRIGDSKIYRPSGNSNKETTGLIEEEDELLAHNET